MKAEFNDRITLLNGVLMIYETLKDNIDLAEGMVDAILEDYVEAEQYEEAAVVLSARTMFQESKNDRNCTVYPRGVEI